MKVYGYYVYVPVVHLSCVHISSKSVHFLYTINVIIKLHTSNINQQHRRQFLLHDSEILVSHWTNR